MYLVWTCAYPCTEQGGAELSGIEIRDTEPSNLEQRLRMVKADVSKWQLQRRLRASPSSDFQRYREGATSRSEQQFRAPQAAPSWPEQRFRALQGAPSRPEQRFRAPQAAPSRPEQRFRAPQAISSDSTVFSSAISSESPGRPRRAPEDSHGNLILDGYVYMWAAESDIPTAVDMRVCI